jgi:PPOX class probable F420-dependent enzyme
VSVRLDEDEVRAFLDQGHTGILATLRSDGSPAVMPLWYVQVDGSVFVRTLARSRKAKALAADPRVSFLVESGRAWAELKAVVLYGRAEAETDPDVIAAVDASLATKYAAFTMPAVASDDTRRHYAQERVHLRIVPDRRALTWDNAKIVPAA